MTLVKIVGPKTRFKKITKVSSKFHCDTYGPNSSFREYILGNCYCGNKRNSQFESLSKFY